MIKKSNKKIIYGHTIKITVSPLSSDQNFKILVTTQNEKIITIINITIIAEAINDSFVKYKVEIHMNENSTSNSSITVTSLLLL